MLELGKARIGGGGGVEPMDADHVDGAAALLTQIEELREPVDVRLRLQQPRRADLNIRRRLCVRLHQPHVVVHSGRFALMISPLGIRLAEAEENLLMIFVDGVPCVFFPFGF